MRAKADRDWLEDRDTPFPRGYRARETRERVLSTALRLIAEQGETGFSLNEVLRRTRVSKGSFFHFFEDLDDLCLACFDRCKALTEPELRASDFASVEALLLAFGDETAARTSSRRFLRLLMFFGQRAMNDARFRAIQVELTDTYQQAVAALVLGIESSLDRERVLEAVGFLLIVIQGIASHRVLFEDQARMSRVWPHAVRAALAIMRGVSPSDRGPPPDGPPARARKRSEPKASRAAKPHRPPREH